MEGREGFTSPSSRRKAIGAFVIQKTKPQPFCPIRDVEEKRRENLEILETGIS